MEYIKLCLLIGMGVSLLWLTIRLIRTHKIKTVLYSSVLSGLLALIAVCVLGHFQNETLHINPYTLGTASVLGIPGVILMMAIKLIWVL